MAPQPSDSVQLSTPDLAEWTIRMVEQGDTALTPTGPKSKLSMKEMLRHKKATKSDARFTWVIADFSGRAKVGNGRTMPVWIAPRGIR